MAIDRLKNPFGATQVTSGLAPENWSYSNAQSGGDTPFTFTGDGTAGTVNGGIYRVHRFPYAAGASMDITFSQAGIIDALICAGGGGGRGHLASSNSYSGGGGGAGGLILQYSYGVTASTYSITVGQGGYHTDGLGPFYYRSAFDDGDNSVFGSLTAIGGGAAGVGYTNPIEGYPGGSGGGASSNSATGNPQGIRNGGSGTASQGNDGGSGGNRLVYYGSGGGGGYLTAGGSPSSTDTSVGGGDGGDGLANFKFDGLSNGYAAGGGGGSMSTTSYGPHGTGGAGGGGDAAQTAGAASAATGIGCGGGGGHGSSSTFRGGRGSDGIVIIRYRIG